MSNWTCVLRILRNQCRFCSGDIKNRLRLWNEIVLGRIKLLWGSHTHTCSRRRWYDKSTQTLKRRVNKYHGMSMRCLKFRNYNVSPGAGSLTLFCNFDLFILNILILSWIKSNQGQKTSLWAWHCWTPGLVCFFRRLVPGDLTWYIF